MSLYFQLITNKLAHQPSNISQAILLTISFEFQLNFDLTNF